MPMDAGLFMMPNHPPHRDYAEGHFHNLDTLAFADAIGFEEAWIGEHFTCKREPLPAPDLLIAQALLKTERIRLGAGAFLLPYHVPAELAHRIAWLDRISGGRFMVGIGAGGLPTDHVMFDVDAAAGENRDMMAEAFELMVKFWTIDGPFQHEGKYYKGGRPEPIGPNLAFHLQPMTKPYPKVSIAGLSGSSPTLRFAGSRGLMPMSLCWSPDHLISHWRVYCEGADSAGLTPNRADWRIGCEIMIAETDAEARRLAVEGSLGECWRNYMLPLMRQNNFISGCKHDQSVPDSDVTVDYLADKVWIVGSPKTAAEKLARLRDTVGDFGCLLQVVYDHLDDMEAYRGSLTALRDEVMPQFQ
jgi:alkanesulfonate monooxygenase SsuD/methylene tetrahydromethanopterin reductase-like flavin-dependent oxidoreductase (luciferase family)